MLKFPVDLLNVSIILGVAKHSLGHSTIPFSNAQSSQAH